MRIIEDKTEEIVKCGQCKSIFAFSRTDIENRKIAHNSFGYTGFEVRGFITCPCCKNSNTVDRFEKIEGEDK